MTDVQNLVDLAWKRQLLDQPLAWVLGVLWKSLENAQQAVIILSYSPEWVEPEIGESGVVESIKEKVWRNQNWISA